MNLILRALFIIIAAVLVGTVASPASAKAAPSVEWIVGDDVAQTATVAVGDSVTLTASFPKACRDRAVALKVNNDGVWSTVIALETGAMPAFAYSMASYETGTATYKFLVKREGRCAGARSTFTLAVR